jgi:phosphoribosylformylglycinamidine synthase
MPEDSRKLYRDRDMKDEMLPPKRIMDGVIKGINVGGNQSGIPTPNGFMLFDESYRGKPLVFAGTIGLIPRKLGKKKLYEKKAMPGDYIVIIGGRTGVDGIHGATFSSVSLDFGSPATAVQIGDAITQKKFSDAIAKEARDLGLYNSITDNGAGGFSSSISEMAKESRGCHVELEKAPLKYPGLEPWQIWISESQERMTLSVPKKKWSAFRNLMKRRGVEAVIVGTFTDSGKCTVTYQKKKVMDISLDFLHDGIPQKHLVTEKPAISYMIWREPKIKAPKDFTVSLLSLLKRHNLSSHEFVSRQYDHEVMAGSVLKPTQGAGRVTADAAVFKPVLQSPKAVVLSSGVAPYYANIDPYAMAAAAIDTAVRNSIAVGASLDHLALLDNFCWASSNEPERLWQLKEAARACYDVAVAYGTPYISGKDSMFNDFKGYDEAGNSLKISVLPTLLISTIGVISEATKAISMDVKAAGDAVYLLGETNDELGGSEYYRMIAEHGQQGKWGSTVPKVDTKKNLQLYRAFEKAGKADFVSSAISVGRGGLSVALARMTMAGKRGIVADISKIRGRAKVSYAKLFSESQGRIVATVSPESAKKFESLFKGLPFSKIGTVQKSASLEISDGRKKLVGASVEKLLETYRERFKNW